MRRSTRAGVFAAVAVLAATSLGGVAVTTASEAAVVVDAPVVEDVFVRGGTHADTNFGSSGALNWKTSNGNADLRRESYLTFDVSGLDSPVEQATLWLHGRVSGGHADDYPDAVPNYVYEVPDPAWTADALTWNTKPSASAEPATSFVVGGPMGQEHRWFGVDLTDLIASAVDDGRDQVGIAIRRDESTGPIVSAGSTRSSMPPRLEINGSPPPAAPRDLVPEHDAFARGGDHADTNFGDSEVLEWKATSSSPDYRRETFLTFGLDDLDGAVERATLWLYGRITAGEPADYPDTVRNHVYEVPDPDWATGGLTWNTRPAVGAQPVASFTIGGGGGQQDHWYKVDVTDLVADAVSDGRSVVGLAIKRDQATVPMVSVGSSRSATPPRVEINGPPVVRSVLYPEDWEPGQVDAQGRFLHDFSYAGYRHGQEPPTQVPGPTVDVTDAPYGADPSGATDSTTAIQAAIDAVGTGGGGTVYLPAGTYRVAPPNDGRAVLHLPYDDVLVRGDGPGQTFVLNTDDQMRRRSVFLIAPQSGDFQRWHNEPATAVDITSDIMTPTTTLHVASAGGFEVGDWVVLRTDTTQEWLDEHPVQPAQEWDTDTFGGLAYHRQITSVNSGAGTVTIDIPTRYKMLTRDNLRLHHAPDPVEGTGVFDLSIGMQESELSGTGENDYNVPGTLGYAVHGSAAIRFNNAVHSWARNVHSYQPEANNSDFHLLSHGISLIDARSITVVGADMRNPQYRGAGGNGYMYAIVASDNLLRDVHAERGRHNYVIQTIQATGNVLLDSHAKDGERASEFHRQLSAANMFDNVSVENDKLAGYYRAVLQHAHSTTESVFWNISGQNCAAPVSGGSERLVRSQQFGWGYVIGTTGTGGCANVLTPGGQFTEPVDHLEHHGNGEYLEPRSLYIDQLTRRLTGG